MGKQGQDRKVANGLVALSSAAVLAVYSAGYTRTRAAADRFTAQTEARRPAVAEPQPVAVVAPPAPAADRAPAPVNRRPVPSSRKRTRQRSIAAITPPAPTPALSAAPTPSAPALAAPSAPSASSASASAQATADKPQYHDGTYFGWGTSRHGDIQAQVVIENGRIAAATIAQCLTRYSCSVIARLPPQVAERQSPEVDYVSGATQSTNAFYYAVVEALGQAKAK